MPSTYFGKKMYFFWREILYYLGIFLNFFGSSVSINICNEFKYKCLQHNSCYLSNESNFSIKSFFQHAYAHLNGKLV